MPERYIVSKNRDEIYYEHAKRYSFAGAFIGGREVLDVACGSGYGSYYLAKNGARHVTGIDISEEMIRYCRSRYRRPNLEFQVMDAADLKFPDNSFDAVISFETIEHIYQPELFLSGLKRVLKPEGMLVISTPNKAVYGLLPEDAHEFHLREFYLDEFKELLGRFFNIQKLYGEKRSKYYEEKMSGYKRRMEEAPKRNILLRSNPLKFKNLIPNKLRYYLSDQIIKLSGKVIRMSSPLPSVSSLEDLTISEEGIEESKFFIAVC